VSGGFLEQAFVYLLAAVVAVPVARRLGLGSVLGYLAAGVAIGPFGLALLGTGGEDVMHVAEFGVVMMLFVIGLELQPSLLWRMRGPILGLGGLQVVATTAAFAGLGMALGMPWRAALAVGMILSLSSTAMVLQALAERGKLRTAGGESAFSVLLFQDIAVIPMLAMFPLLAVAPAHGAAEAGHGAETWVAGLPAWAQTLAVLGSVAGVVAGGRFVVRPAFRMIARTGLREMFTAAALLLVIGIALLMSRVGLSPALGTFVAGVVLADSEYRHELEGDLDPFKGLLLGLFFIAVGATIDFALVAEAPGRIAALVVGIMAVKLALLLVLARVFRLSTEQALLFAFALPQVGEFAFVLLSLAGQEGVLGAETTGPLVAAVALSMAVTPLLMLLNERVVQPRMGCRVAPAQRDADEIDPGHSPVLIAGFGAFGATVGRLLKANGVATTVLDVDSDRVDLLRSLGLSVYYGDATRPELLQAAGAAHARLLVIAVDTPERTREIAETARRHHPHLAVLARAFDWDDAHELIEAGVGHVYRESLDSSLRLGEEALRLLGFRAHQAHRSAQKFRRHDEESVRELTEDRGDRSLYLSRARQRIGDLEALLRADLEEVGLDRDAGWDQETLRDEARRGVVPPSPADAEAVPARDGG
jgi:CPA2 family monovalent cation:H+ antiporter-2